MNNVITEALEGTRIQFPEIPRSPLFEVGNVQITARAAGALLSRYPSDEEAGAAFIGFLLRHMGGDWEHMADEERDDNQNACRVETLVMSQFPLPLLPGEALAEDLVIVTGDDRSWTEVSVLSEVGADGEVNCEDRDPDDEGFDDIFDDD